MSSRSIRVLNLALCPNILISLQMPWPSPNLCPRLTPRPRSRTRSFSSCRHLSQRFAMLIIDQKVAASHFHEDVERRRGLTCIISPCLELGPQQQLVLLLPGSRTKRKNHKKSKHYSAWLVENKKNPPPPPVASLESLVQKGGI